MSISPGIRSLRLCALISLFCCSNIKAQEFNYWSQQVGSHATLLSGAVTASVQDNSAIYYNPGALGFMTNSSLSVVGNLVYLRTQGIRNGAGNDLRFKNTNVDAASQIFSAIQKITDNFSITYGLLTRYYHQMQFISRHEGFYDVLSTHPGEEYYRGSFDYYKRNREDWLGFGMGWRIHPKIGFGISIFGAASNTDYSSSVSSNVFTFDPVLQSNRLEAYNVQNEVLQYRNVGLLFVAGFAIDNGDFQLGLNITSPITNIDFISKGMFDRKVSVNIPLYQAYPHTVGFTADRTITDRKTPLIIDFGIAKVFGLYTSSNIKISYFSKVDPYQMIRATKPENDPINFYPDDPLFYQISHAHKHTINFAVGIERRVSEELSILGGFNTDFNYMPQDEITDIFNYYNSVSYLNVYNIAGGVNWFREKFNLILGLTFDSGYKFGQPQQINLLDPKDTHNLFGPIQNNTENFYLRVNFVFGFTYLFPRI